MASAQRMMIAGIMFVVGESILIMMTFYGGILLTYFNNFMMAQTVSPLLADSLGGLMGWISVFYYAIILVCGIALPYRIYQEVIAITDYFPDAGLL